jgi:adenylate cyclase class 2
MKPNYYVDKVINMVIELEKKFRIKDTGAIFTRLRGIGAEYWSRVNIEDTYYDSKDGTLTKKGMSLRHRSEFSDMFGPPLHANHFLTVKGPKEGDERKEVELGCVPKVEAITGFLHALGFSAIATVQKSRTTWIRMGYNVSVDEVEGLGNFVEIEFIGKEDRPYLMERGQIEDLAFLLLGLDPEDEVKESYLEMTVAKALEE